ncbi:DUF1102 domain-containing protein [Halobacteria archaeon HArc-gm2]|nr:DUF1102 domain-containing protein [Halobacteria archaeon HArc-gm2]
MQRRKFMIGVGSLAAGSAAAMGTGAFTSVTASRDVDVEVASDASAYLRLEGAGGPNAPYVTDDGSSGTLGITLDPSNSTAAGGEGVNPDALTRIDDLFVVENQGTQSVDVSIAKSGDNSGLVCFFANDAQGASDPYDESNGSTARIDGSGNDVTLSPGESVYVSLQIDTRGEGVGDGDELLDTVVVEAVA